MKINCRLKLFCADIDQFYTVTCIKSPCKNSIRLAEIYNMCWITKLELNQPTITHKIKLMRNLKYFSNLCINDKIVKSKNENILKILFNMNITFDCGYFNYYCYIPPTKKKYSIFPSTVSDNHYYVACSDTN